MNFYLIISVWRFQVIDGVGVEGWVEVNDDWLFVAVGNERLLRSGGGKVNLSLCDQAKVHAFTTEHNGSAFIYICVEDSPLIVLAVSG